MLRRTTLAVLLALALIAAACSTGGTPQAEGPSIAALPPTLADFSTAAAEGEGGVTPEGIQVHGHWTLDIRGADGSIEDRREFENALTPDGQVQLILLLTGECESIDWAIELTGDFLPEGSDSRLPGSITINAPDISRVSDSSGLYLSLSGSANREDAFFIGGVKTHVALDDTAPDTSICGIREFTKASISEFEVPANKTVDVVVEFRFS